MEMRKSRGIVKVRAMRVSEDGRRFREFAWAPEDSDPASLRGTITLSLHLCHFAEATLETQPPSVSSKTAAPGQAAADGISRPPAAESQHPILAPPTTRQTASRLWTWFWRDEQPRMTFVFHYGTKEYLQSKGVIPAAPAMTIQPQTPVEESS